MGKQNHNIPGPPPEKGGLNRRAMISQGSSMLGGFLLYPAVSAGAGRASDENENAVFNVRKFGASGSREENATAQIRAAVEACAANGGGTVYVPPGDYTTGTIKLLDNVTLHLEAGATLYLSQLREDFIPGSRTMILGENARNISVTGKGALDGLAKYEFVDMRGLDPEIADEIEIARKAGIDMRRYYRTGMQTFMFIFNNCTNILLRDITVINSPLWNVRFNDCDRVYVRGVYIYSDLEKGVNADGIDIVSSRNVTISDSVIITADDAIVIKTIPRNDQPANPAENITVTNCILSSSSTALMIGTETHADVKGVNFSHCVIRNSNKGFGINVQDGAVVSDVIISHLTIETGRRHWNWWGSAEMCKFVLKKRSPESKLGEIRNIIIDHIIAHCRGTSTIRGHAERPLENIRMNDIQIFMEPEDAKDKRATHALDISRVRDLVIRDMSVNWMEEHAEPLWKSALVLNEVIDFELRSFTGRQGLRNSDNPAILLNEVSDGIIYDSRASSGCTAFIQVQGENSGDIIFRNNNMARSLKGITYDNEGLKNRVKEN